MVRGSIKVVYLASVDDLTVNVMGARSVEAAWVVMAEGCMMIIEQGASRVRIGGWANDESYIPESIGGLVKRLIV